VEQLERDIRRERILRKKQTNQQPTLYHFFDKKTELARFFAGSAKQQPLCQEVISGITADCWLIEDLPCLTGGWSLPVHLTMLVVFLLED
jgi:hypothetical protein